MNNYYNNNNNNFYKKNTKYYQKNNQKFRSTSTSNVTQEEPSVDLLTPVVNLFAPNNEPVRTPKPTKYVKPIDIIIMERAYKVLAGGNIDEFYSYCDENGIDDDDKERIASRYDRVQGIAKPFNRKNFPAKKGKRRSRYWESPPRPHSL